MYFHTIAHVTFIQFQLEFVLVPCGKWFLNYVGQDREIYNTNLTIRQSLDWKVIQFQSIIFI
jgi:hypothetical protein